MVLTHVKRDSYRIEVEIKLDLRDLWVGAYWSTATVINSNTLHVKVCIVPCVALVVTVARPSPHRWVKRFGSRNDAMKQLLRIGRVAVPEMVIEPVDPLVEIVDPPSPSSQKLGVDTHG